MLATARVMWSAMARRMGESGIRAVVGFDDCKWCKTSCLVSRPAREVTWRASNPCSANSRAATGVGFGAGEVPAAGDVAAAGDEGGADEDSRDDGGTPADGGLASEGGPDGVGGAAVPIRAIGVSMGTVWPSATRNS